MNEPKISRRDLSRNIARFGVVGALAALFGLKSKNADAGPYCYSYWEYRPVSSCQSWTCYVTVCNGVIVSRTNCGYTSRNNCAYYGKPPSCCG